jgi:hypothetical protein
VPQLCLGETEFDIGKHCKVLIARLQHQNKTSSSREGLSFKSFPCDPTNNRGRRNESDGLCASEIRTVRDGKLEQTVSVRDARLEAVAVSGRAHANGAAIEAAARSPSARKRRRRG